MRLANVRLERYGPFEALDLPLDPTPGRVNLIVAPNGYGKSVIRRAIGEFLFGIEARTPMTFRFGTEKMRILADVVQDGSDRRLVRRKGNGNTLALLDGPEIPPDEGRRMFGGADETVFRELFGLDTTLLRSGGKELIRSQGRLGQVLFAAGGGMGRVRELLTELERKRDELGRATARHRSRPLWNALSEWEQANSDLRRVALRPDGWSTLEHQAIDAARLLNTLLDEQAAGVAERDRLRTIGASRPWLAKLRAAERTRVEAGDAPELDEAFERRWRDALEAGATSASLATAAETELLAAQEARSALGFDPVWLAAETEIDTLPALRGRAQGAEADLPDVERNLAEERAKSASLRQDLGWDVVFPLPPAPVVKDAQRRLQQHPKLAAEAAAAVARLADADRVLAATLAELTALPVESDVAAVADFVRLLTAGGDPGARLEAGQRKLRTAEAALQSALTTIPDCPLAEAALGTTAAPSDATLDAAEKALGQAESALAQANRDLAVQTGAIATETTNLAALERTAMLPPPDALAAARAHRNTLWLRLCTPMAERPDPAAAVALDRAMREADTIADALIAHGQEVAQAAGLRSRLASLNVERTKAEDAVTRATGGIAGARNQLLLIARAAGGNATNVSALRAFLRARATAVLRRTDRDTAAAELSDIVAHLVQLGGQLAGAMGVPLPDVAALGALLAEAERRTEAARNLAARRKTLTEQVGKQRTAFASAAAAASKADRALADWVEQWALVALALSRPENEAQAATSDALALVEELRGTEHKAQDAERRIADMHAAITLLTSKIAGLSALSPDLEALPPIEAADGFQRRLQAERQQAARCADADKRIAHATEKLAANRMASGAAAGTLTGLRAALRVETDEAAEEQLRRVRTVATAAKDAAEAQRELAVQGGGLSVEALAERAARTTAEADAASIAAIDAGHAERAPLIEAAREASIAAAAALERAGTGLEAAEAAQRRQAAQAVLARTAEEALVLHATHALLQAALDRQATGADQPLLTRIGTVFRTITGGAQAGVRIEETKDGQTMVALEADGVTRKALDQLSEGTSDQLYLALRIAALEDYAAATSPLPFIADDVLQTFDDPRTTATLQALVALSHRVQVIALTHHEHLGGLVEQLPAGAVHVMRLGD
jgi:uncharacterized protein YhaN